MTRIKSNRLLEEICSDCITNSINSESIQKLKNLDNLVTVKNTTLYPDAWERDYETMLMLLLRSWETLKEFLRDRENRCPDLVEYFLVYLPFFIWIDHTYKKRDNALLIGHYGGAGIGKTTSSMMMKIAAESCGLKSIVLSLDDFYFLPQELAFLKDLGYDGFRGPPGTHDTSLMLEKLTSLKSRNYDEIELPVFNKALGRRIQNGSIFTETFDVIIFEGIWLGTNIPPYTKVASIKDPYKRIVAEKLENYKIIWNLLDILVARPLLSVSTITTMFDEQLDDHRARAKKDSIKWVGMKKSDVPGHIRRLYSDPWCNGKTEPEPQFDHTTVYFHTNKKRIIHLVERGGSNKDISGFNQCNTRPSI